MHSVFGLVLNVQLSHAARNSVLIGSKTESSRTLLFSSRRLLRQLLCEFVLADPGDPRGLGLGLRLLDYWDCGFESRRGMGVCVIWVLYSKDKRRNPGQSRQGNKYKERTREYKEITPKA
jgi:hypothetical protein